jgi:hypothetical protein
LDTFILLQKSKARKKALTFIERKNKKAVAYPLCILQRHIGGLLDNPRETIFLPSLAVSCLFVFLFLENKRTRREKRRKTIGN